MIPSSIQILNQELPDAPGVYFYYDLNGKLLYIGKATSLKKRVGSYFNKAQNARISDLVANIARIEYIQVPTVIEALVLESNQIRAFQPPYNVLSRDDKSFLYLCITNEDYPKPIFLRGLDLERMGIRPFTKTLSLVAKKKFLAVFGPYISSRSLRIALELIRRPIPWSLCEYREGGNPCFDAQIGRCPGVCTGEISKKEYRRIIHQLIKFFEGKKKSIVKQMARDMKHAAMMKDFEVAADLRNKIDALEHVNDVALIMREDDWDIVGKNAVVEDGRLNAFGRIEAYDIAHIGGTSTVASMVVFENGKPYRPAYRKFRIKSFEGTNDVAAMEEVMRRRLNRFRMSPNTWSLPDVIVIDGGEGQINRVKEVLKEFGIEIPVVGIAKGFDRKQDRFIYDLDNAELRRIVESDRALFQLARDEAHRFAGAYHRVLRSRNSGI